MLVTFILPSTSAEGGMTSTDFVCDRLGFPSDSVGECDGRVRSTSGDISGLRATVPSCTCYRCRALSS